MSAPNPPPFEPFVPASETPKEFTLTPILVGTLLGILFGASSMYLVLKVGLTVSASIPVAVLSFALFRGLSKAFGLRQRTVLENNIVQTAGSAGESIAFAVGLVMPALFLIGYDMDVVRVTTVGTLGGLLGILMMIPLRRVFIVQKHGELKYPEGTACADVLKAGEKGGSAAGLLFAGFGIGFVVTALQKVFKVFKEETEHSLAGTGLKGGAVGGEWTSPLLGVGYIIGPRIASIMVAGGVLAYLVVTPTIAYIGENLTEPVFPAKNAVNDDGVNEGLIRNMDAGGIRTHYILYIGAGAVAAGGIFSMLKALPVIVGSVASTFRDLRSGPGGGAAVKRTDRDMPMSVVLFGGVGLILALALAPSLGLGLNLTGILGACMIFLFGFLFVTVSSRLTGEIGSSSNPISGMTVATLLFVCLILLGLGETGVITLSKETKLLALTIAGVVCIASSNGGTTAQALKTGHLLGATPIWQQYAILIGTLTSAVVVGFVLLIMNNAGTIYSNLKLPTAKADVSQLTAKQRVPRGPHAGDPKEYFVLTVADGEMPGVDGGKYLVDENGAFAYLCDPAVNGKLKTEDGSTEPVDRFKAPKTQLVAFIINGLFDKKLPWGLVMIGVLIAVTLELSGVPSLPFAVGVYLPLASSVPIFLGGALRWLTDTLRKAPPEEGDSGPGVLMASGYIAGGSIAAVVAAFLAFDQPFLKSLNLSSMMPDGVKGETGILTVFALMMLVLAWVGWRHGKK